MKNKENEKPCKKTNQHQDFMQQVRQQDSETGEKHNMMAVMLGSKAYQK